MSFVYLPIEKETALIQHIRNSVFIAVMYFNKKMTLVTVLIISLKGFYGNLQYMN